MNVYSMTSRFEGKTLIVVEPAIGHECSLELKGWSDDLCASVIRGAEMEPILLTEIGDWLFEVDDPRSRRGNKRSHNSFKPV